MIQVLGLRDRLDHSGRKREVFFGKNWRFETITDVFNIDALSSVLAKVPETERYNLYFTVADCFEEKGRKLKEQWALPFDIDGIHIESEETIVRDATRVAEEALAVIGVDYRNCGVTFSGNGVQLFILLDRPILSDEFFDNLRPHYAAVCARIQSALAEKNIQGKVDTSVFSGARLMRLPNTENRKPNKPTRTARIINGLFSPLALDLTELSGLDHLERAEVVPNQALRNYPKPDSQAVCDGCAFLKHCKAEPEKVSEPEWYAMLSITSRLDNGRDLSHAMSEGHPAYTHYEADLKIDQALKSSGPRTCKNIDTLWGKCHTCEYADRVVSPILIKGKDYIGSADFGFRERKTREDGTVVSGRPIYEDLIKQYGLTHPYKTIAETNEICRYDGKIWAPVSDATLKHWMNEHVRPAPSGSEMLEFVARLKVQTVVPRDWFTDSTNRKLNFKNCVLDVSTAEVTPHRPDYGFFNILPFDYDKHATAPTWDKFLKDIANGDEGTVEMLEEFAGYCISGDDCWLQKALLLVGEGANGKSTFMETVGNVVGRNNRSSVPFQDLENDTKKYLLINKLFNFSEETSNKALFESSTFKNLVTGGYMTVRQLYIQPYEIKNRAKFILSANELPYSADKTHGFLRRLVIVKLERQFNVNDPGHDPHLQDKLNLELAGICNKLIAAYARMKHRKSITDKFDNRKNVEEYMIESNNVSRFFLDNILVDNFAECNAGDLYDEYRAYCEQNGERPFYSSKFIKLLAKHVPSIKEMRVVAKVGGKSTKMYRGIQLLKSF